MKKSTFFKVLMTLVMAVMVGNLSAQDVAGGADFVLYDAVQATPTAIDSVTASSTTPYYVKPDAVYHPLYVNPAYTLTADFTWTWTPDVGNPAAVTLTQAGAANYATLGWPATLGNYSYDITENAPAAYGGCSGSVTVLNTEVIAAPTMAFDATGIDASIERCEAHADIAGDVIAAITSSVGDNEQKQIDWSLHIYTLQSDHSTPATYYDTDQTTALGAGVAAEDFDGASGTQQLSQQVDLFQLLLLLLKLQLYILIP